MVLKLFIIIILTFEHYIYEEESLLSRTKFKLYTGCFHYLRKLTFFLFKNVMRFTLFGHNKRVCVPDHYHIIL